MQALNSHPDKVANKGIFLFLVSWFIINCLQAAFTDLHPDEAYYWVYSRSLDWGYFDHPPMIALFIKAGYALFANEFGLRLLVICATSLSLYLTWLLAKAYQIRISTFLWITAPLFLLHIYGFIATPDAPLLLFCTLFYYCFKQYQEKDSLLNALFLGLICAGLLYSKYHGILLIGFTILSDLNILKRRTFWIAVFCAVLLFTPHILWQIQHDFPSIKYHLIDRSAKPYSFDNTSNYLLNEWLISNPFTGLFLFYFAFKQSTKGQPFLRSLRFNFIGVFAFFLLSSFKGWVEAHWTLIGFIPALILAAKYLEEHPDRLRIFRPLAIIGISCILIVRFLFIVPFEFSKQIPFLRDFFGAKEWADTIHKHTHGKSIVFPDRFQEPSVYMFYAKDHPSALGYSSWAYRKTQFQIWDFEEEMQKDTVYYLSHHSEGMDDSISTPKGVLYSKRLENFHSYQKVQISIQLTTNKQKAGERVFLPVHIQSPYPYPIKFSASKEQKTVLTYGFWQKGKVVQMADISLPLTGTIIAEGHRNMVIPVTFPRKKGDYQLFVTLQTHPFTPGLNSQFLNISID